MAGFKQHYNPDGLIVSSLGDLIVNAETFRQSIVLSEYIANHSRHYGVMSLRSLMQYVYQKIDLLFSEPDRETDNPEQRDEQRDEQRRTPDRTNYQTLLDSLLLRTSDKRINDAIIDFFKVNSIVQTYPMLRYLMNRKIWYWEEFCKEVTHRRRYTFFDKEDLFKIKLSNNDDSKDLFKTVIEISLDEFVQPNQLADIIRCREIESGKVFTQGCCCGCIDDCNFCRYYRGDKCGSVEFNDLTSAPDNVAKNGRWSPSFTSMFYGAADVETAKKEIMNPRSYIEGHFALRRPIQLLNLAKVPYYEVWSENYAEYSLIDAFERALSKPVIDKDRDYIGTQAFAEYIRYNEDLKVKGIIYRSAKDEDANNCVLFCNQQDSRKLLELKSAIVHLGRFSRPMHIYNI